MSRTLSADYLMDKDGTHLEIRECKKDQRLLRRHLWQDQSTNASEFAQAAKQLAARSIENLKGRKSRKDQSTLIAFAFDYSKFLSAGYDPVDALLQTKLNTHPHFDRANFNVDCGYREILISIKPGRRDRSSEV